MFGSKKEKKKETPTGSPKGFSTSTSSKRTSIFTFQEQVAQQQQPHKSNNNNYNPSPNTSSSSFQKEESTTPKTTSPNGTLQDDEDDMDFIVSSRVPSTRLSSSSSSPLARKSSSSSFQAQEKKTDALAELDDILFSMKEVVETRRTNSKLPRISTQLEEPAAQATLRFTPTLITPTETVNTRSIRSESEADLNDIEQLLNDMSNSLLPTASKSSLVVNAKNDPNKEKEEEEKRKRNEEDFMRKLIEDEKKREAEEKKKQEEERKRQEEEKRRQEEENRLEEERRKEQERLIQKEKEEIIKKQLEEERLLWEAEQRKWEEEQRKREQQIIEQRRKLEEQRKMIEDEKRRQEELERKIKEEEEAERKRLEAEEEERQRQEMVKKEEEMRRREEERIKSIQENRRKMEEAKRKQEEDDRLAELRRFKQEEEERMRKEKIEIERQRLELEAERRKFITLRLAEEEREMKRLQEERLKREQDRIQIKNKEQEVASQISNSRPASMDYSQQRNSFTPPNTKFTKPPTVTVEEIKQMVINVVTRGKEVVGFLNMEDLKQFDARRFSEAVNEFVRTITHGIMLIPGGKEAREHVLSLTDSLIKNSHKFSRVIKVATELGGIDDQTIDQASNGVRDGMGQLLSFVKTAAKSATEQAPLASQMPSRTEQTPLSPVPNLSASKRNSFIPPEPPAPMSPAPLRDEFKEYIRDCVSKSANLLNILRTPSRFNLADFIQALQSVVSSIRAGSDIIKNPEDKGRLADSLRELLQQGIRLKQANGAETQRKDVIYAITETLTIITSLSN